ncbi:hypothetical protein J3P89_23250 [Pseudomonas sp. Z1-14]|uniref:hypothetical protein n=1 Tax=Pseudomonas sp. Z1-14 TaxID=2817409 RepID=UPI003DA8E4F1
MSPIREQARSHSWIGVKLKKQTGYYAASLLILIWGAPFTTLVERRHCAVGL